MPATTGTSRDRNRTPLTPRVTTARRGGHVVSRSEPVVQEQVHESPAALGVRVSPNAIMAPRGGVRLRAIAGTNGAFRAERRFAVR